ncbi:ATP synthase F1 subunit delta [Siphonobacter sp.]|uniref:ATP synthase F1 subunit delta n=1 Tax=Siphonobacter sp. TaxID=1869184 RepID=UPI003B3BD77B
MSDQSVAFRYAKSLIGLAQEKGVLDNVQEDMQLFTQICQTNRDFSLALNSPIVKHWKKLEILKALFQTRVSPVTFSIFEIITKKNRESILPAVAREFNRQYQELKGIQVAHITTASPLTDVQRTQFKAVVSQQTGKSIELSETVDPNLIGGYLLRVGDNQIDNSIKSRLNDLKIQFAQS